MLFESTNFNSIFKLVKFILDYFSLIYTLRFIYLPKVHSLPGTQIMWLLKQKIAAAPFNALGDIPFSGGFKKMPHITRPYLDYPLAKTASKLLVTCLQVMSAFLES